jgi:hypothetical protein
MKPALSSDSNVGRNFERRAEAIAAAAETRCQREAKQISVIPEATRVQARKRLGTRVLSGTQSSLRTRLGSRS